MNLFKKIFKRKFAVPQQKTGIWSIGIYAGLSPFDLHQPENIENPVIQAQDVTDMPAEFVADPFMIKQGSSWYMFFEVFNPENRRGHIAFATSSDGFKWKYEKAVLSEPFSLSYPYIFKWDEKYYLIPECNDSRSVRLYRAENFPEKWKFVKTLLKKQRFSDASIVRYNDLWWIFVATRSRPINNGILRLYHSLQLEGAWNEHPKSPVVKNNPHIARPGGRILVYQNRLIRYAQDDYPEYGKQVLGFIITKLTTSEYEEQALDHPVIAPSGKGWNAKRMHTVDPHEYPDKCLLNIGNHADKFFIACVDGWGYQQTPASEKAPPELKQT